MNGLRFKPQLMLRSDALFSRLPRRAPEYLSGIARRGAAWKPLGGRWAGSPFCRPPTNTPLGTSARSARHERQPGRLFFGYFLLAAQKKVARLRVREPDLKNIAIAIHYCLFSSHKK